MTTSYLCPACGTNRSRFNIIEQVIHAVKKDPQTGVILEYLSPDDPLQYKYQGPLRRVQCGICGMIEAEDLFIHHAERQKQN